MLRKTLLCALLLISAGRLAHAEEHLFDPSRDSAKDLAAAETRAAAEHKNILLDVGGDWCSWCHLLEHTLRGNPQLTSVLEKNYILLHIDFSRDHENKAYLSRYPTIDGYPHLFVIAPDGRLLQSQSTSVLEVDHKTAGGYNQPAILEFLNKWAPTR
jgi:thiol:disulfide interchange protein